VVTGESQRRSANQRQHHQSRLSILNRGGVVKKQKGFKQLIYYFWKKKG